MLILGNSSGAGTPATKVDVFTAGGNWMRDPAAKMIYLLLIGGGGSGCPGSVVGDGNTGSYDANAASGGAGGGGGSVTEVWLDASLIPVNANCNVSVGSGGDAVPYDNWSWGSRGSSSQITWNGGGIRALGGYEGRLPDAPGQMSDLLPGGAGGAGGSSSNSYWGQDSTQTQGSPTGGAGGGGIDGNGNPQWGGTSQVPYPTWGQSNGGMPGDTGIPGQNTTTFGYVGTGGAGGAANTNANGQNGADALNYGGGGGGGGAAATGFTAGAGGKGGDGIVVIAQFF